MPTSDAEAVRAVVTGDGQGQRFVLTDEAALDDAVVSGRWLKAGPDATAEVRR